MPPAVVIGRTRACRSNRASDPLRRLQPRPPPSPRIADFGDTVVQFHSRVVKRVELPIFLRRVVGVRHPGVQGGGPHRMPARHAPSPATPSRETRACRNCNADARGWAGEEWRAAPGRRRPSEGSAWWTGDSRESRSATPGVGVRPGAALNPRSARARACPPPPSAAPHRPGGRGGPRRARRGSPGCPRRSSRGGRPGVT